MEISGRAYSLYLFLFGCIKSLASEAPPQQIPLSRTPTAAASIIASALRVGSYFGPRLKLCIFRDITNCSCG